ncbi:MAG: ImmA/IrrE family metallo-endopeptidase [Planctomycetes bacterium]|nr:ImmA/IrrE family metallo-endopeptidase [Planctomycetota bacterium]
MASLDDPVTPEDEFCIRKHAARLLKEAHAAGCFPTPIDQIIEVAKLRFERQTLGAGFLHGLYRGIATKVKSALRKIRALLHVGERVILVDHDEPDARLPWIKAHEAGHSYLPWQREVFTITEDCEQSLDPTVTERFEREANLFAAELLFQGESLQRDAQDLPLGIMTAVNLTKRYGTSIYTGVWRYVSTSLRACAVIVLEKPRLDPVLGPMWPFRRFIASPEFATGFGTPKLPDFFTVRDGVMGEMLPRGRQRLVQPRSFPWPDINGEEHEMLAEAFFTGHNVFLLMYPTKALTRAVLVP